MALASNTKEQLAKRFQADLGIREPALVVEPSVMANGDPMLTIKSAGVAISVAAIQRRSFNGFNVVAELSASAAEGLPEHVLMIMIKNNQTQLVTSKLAMYAKQMGTSSVKIGFTAAVGEADLIEANVAQEIPNDARLGASGQ